MAGADLGGVDPARGGGSDRARPVALTAAPSPRLAATPDDLFTLVRSPAALRSPRPRPAAGAALRLTCLPYGGWRERPDVTPAPIALASAGPSLQPRRVAASALQPDIGSALSLAPHGGSPLPHPRYQFHACDNFCTPHLTVPRAP